MARPTHMSNSQLSSWLHCGKSYQLKRVFNAPSIPSVWLAGGVSLHDTICDINLASVGELEDVDPVHRFQTYFDAFVENQIAESGIPMDQWRVAGRATKEKPNKEDFNWWRFEGARQAQEYKTWLRLSDWKIFVNEGKGMAEFETTATFGGMEVKGFADALMVSPDGELVIVDFKSGTRVPSNKFQLGLYTAAIERALNIPVSKGAYMMTRKTEMTDLFDLSRFTPRYFDNVFSMAKIALENDVYIPNPGDACNMCDVSDYCYSVGGALAWMYDPDHPQYQPQNSSEEMQHVNN